MKIFAKDFKLFLNGEQLQYAEATVDWLGKIVGEDRIFMEMEVYEVNHFALDAYLGRPNNYSEWYGGA